MTPTRLSVLVLAVLLAACGGEERPYFGAGATADGSCRPAGEDGARSFRACYQPHVAGKRLRRSERHGRLEVQVGDDAWRRLNVPHPLGAKPGRPAGGHWEWAAISPDGAWLLAQWIAECEVPIAFLVPSGGGTPLPVTTGRSGPVPSSAIGWTTDGRAIVEVPVHACASKPRVPGTYLLRPLGTLVFWRAEGELSRSIIPRPLG